MPNPQRKPQSKKEREEKELKALKAKAEMTYFDADKRELKSIQEILEKTTVIQEIFIPILGCMVKFGTITMEEFTEMMGDIKDKNKLATEMLYRYLHSADSTVTREDVNNLPFAIGTALTEAVMSNGMGFPKGLESPTQP